MIDEPARWSSKVNKTIKMRMGDEPDNKPEVDDQGSQHQGDESKAPEMGLFLILMSRVLRFQMFFFYQNV